MAFLMAVLVFISLFFVYKKWNRHFRKALVGVAVLLVVGFAVSAIQQSKKTPTPSTISATTAPTAPATSPATFTQIIFEYWWLVLAFIILGVMWWWKGQKWENPFLFLLNGVFLVFYYFLLPGILQKFFFPTWHISMILFIESAFILAVIGVIYYLYSPEKPTQRKKAYTLLNTVGVIFSLFVSWRGPAFFSHNGEPLAWVNDGPTVLEVFFVNFENSPVTGKKLRSITQADVPQAQRLVVTGSDVVRWIPIIGKYMPSPPPPPPPPLLNNPVQFYIGGEKLEAGDHFCVKEVRGKVCIGKKNNPHEPEVLLRKGFEYYVNEGTNPTLGMQVLIEEGTEKSVSLKYRKVRW